jgi:REP element-mobilizing transposase RayT
MAHSVSLSELPAAYLITFHTYGSWLHGEEKGSVDRQNNRPKTEFTPTDCERLEAMRQRMSGDAVTLNDLQRRCVEQAIIGVCKHRFWSLLAINVRTNHIHIVVSVAGSPEKAMSDFKSWATRKLRETDLIRPKEKIWSRHGSTRYLWDDRAVEAACRYVIEGQGNDMS